MIEVKVKKCWIKFAPPEPPLVGFEVDKEVLDEFRPYLGKELGDHILTLKKKMKKSRNMHNYMWVLCDQIAKKRHDFMQWTKEDIYRLAVREVGLWTDVSVDNESTKKLIEDWQNNGVGWFAEVVTVGSTHTILRLYRGASVYSAEDLYRLTNHVVEMAKESGVETISDMELERLKELW